MSEERPKNQVEIVMTYPLGKDHEPVKVSTRVDVEKGWFDDPGYIFGKIQEGLNALLTHEQNKILNQALYNPEAFPHFDPERRDPHSPASVRDSSVSCTCTACDCEHK
jgi:hypothetical protein